MILIEETQVPQSALPVAEFREHLRLGSGFADDSVQDGVLERFLRASMAAIEARTGKILIARDFAWTVSSWRGVASQPLPVAPVTAISALVLIDRDGMERTVDQTRYRLVQDSQQPTIEARGSSLPQIPSSGSARVEFTAGYGPAWTDLPMELSQAVFLLAAHYYEYRHETAYSGSGMPYGVSALIERHRSLRLSSRGNR